MTQEEIKTVIANYNSSSKMKQLDVMFGRLGRRQLRRLQERHKPDSRPSLNSILETIENRRVN